MRLFTYLVSAAIHGLFDSTLLVPYGASFISPIPLHRCKDVGPFEDFATWDITRYRVIVGDPPADRTRGGYMILDWILFRI